jgi:sulfotransferase family protein
MTGHALIPDIIIGGGPRSGTTFLCNLLSKHPDPPFIPEPKVCTISHPAGDPGYLERYHALHSAMRKICHEQNL